MRSILFTYVSPQGDARWTAMSREEWVGGFIVVDVPDRETVEAIAAEWPGLDYAGHAVGVVPAGETVA